MIYIYTDTYTRIHIHEYIYTTYIYIVLLHSTTPKYYYTYIPLLSYIVKLYWLVLDLPNMCGPVLSYLRQQLLICTVLLYTETCDEDRIIPGGQMHGRLGNEFRTVFAVERALSCQSINSRKIQLPSPQQTISHV